MILRARDRELRLGGGTPALMGIVNATPDSFSDGGELPDVAARVARARELVAAGAAIVDVGGETASGLEPAVAAEEEAARIVPVIERVAAELDVVVSVDTHKPSVAEAALAAGAHLVNDVSGLRDPAMAALCARTGAALVIMHTRVEPKGTLLDPGFYDDVVEDVRSFLAERVAVAMGEGVAPEQLLLDPGPDFAKTPAQTVAVLRRLDVLHELGRPLLLPVSRKDFLGAITGRPARERGAATLAAVGWAAGAGAHVLRVHDVAAAADFLAVRSVLRGDRELAPDDGLTADRYPS
ncbi:MAG: dihydropteroate synthase [Solirubrobacteraceae bacterium]